MDTPKEDGGATSRAERHVVVPVEATEEMLRAGQVAVEEPAAPLVGLRRLGNAYRAMLAAAPAAPPAQMEAVGYILDSELDKLRRGMTTTAAISPRPYVKDDVPIFASPVPSPVQMEAVAWRFKYRDCLGWLYRDERDWIPNEPYNVHDVQPLYASPVPSSSERSALLKVEEALMELRLTARVLLQNAEGCAANHYGSDFSEFGPPGWLADSENCIVNAEAALSQLEEARHGK